MIGGRELVTRNLKLVSPCRDEHVRRAVHGEAEVQLPAQRVQPSIRTTPVDREFGRHRESLQRANAVPAFDRGDKKADLPRKAFLLGPLTQRDW